ncbi:MAG: flagellar biosynthesis anti-sigma factor FlgM [Betaproteobacteria bacterium]
MKINSQVGPLTGIPGVQEVSGTKQPTAPQGPGKASGDPVAVSELGKQLQELEKQLNDVSVVDTARVDAIKQAISEGRFTVDSEVVADRLISTVKDYLLSQKT